MISVVPRGPTKFHRTDYTLIVKLIVKRRRIELMPRQLNKLTVVQGQQALQTRLYGDGVASPCKSPRLEEELASGT